MGWRNCDSCDGTNYTDENPFVLFKQVRPSDRHEMTCVLAGHARCFNVKLDKLPDIGNTGGVATPKQWETWIESPEAAEMGFLFST